ncbi:molybdopterin molybdotransferase MoeA [candidate division KSB1 bacterium]|nr:molybdopterin molybdotransferase MoeA [candidate division KSB1 bacterium]
MIKLNEAFEIVLQYTQRLEMERVPLLRAAGRVLAEEVTSDLNMPPFQRSSVDGYAVLAEDLQRLPARLQVLGTIAAGTYPDFALSAGQAAKIMTGAPVPKGADAVQMIERTQSISTTVVEILEAVARGANISPLGSEARLGQVVAPAGNFISPAMIGLLASVGKHEVAAYRAPSVGLIATGDELVEISEQPVGAQIRNSNSYALYAQVESAGATPHALGIARDQKSQLRELIQRGLQHDLLLLTGGVSMGDLDLVEDVFAEFGFEIFFDKVAVKPGKPVVFARAAKTLIFGLPGNPVSASTIFELLVRPAIRKMRGNSVYQNQIIMARLTQRFANRSGRENYAPAWTWYENGAYYVRPLPSKGSGDMVTFAASNSYLICPIDRTELHADEQVQAMLRPEFF